MERKKSSLSGFFDVVNKLEDIVLAILVIGMVVVIMLQIIGLLWDVRSPGQRKLQDICSCG